MSKADNEIKQLIKKEGKKQTQIAYRMGVSPQSLGIMINRGHNMSVSYLIKILEALGHYELVITTTTKAERLKAEDKNNTVYILGGDGES